VAHYTMGAGLEAMRRETSSFYHYNHLGTALALTGADEAVSDTYRHDAWGVLLASTGSTVNPHTYVGRERYYRMPNAEMYHLGFRDYAQGVGRFTTVDPLQHPLQHRGYTYVSGDPTRALDPDGRNPVVIVIGVVGLCVVAAVIVHLWPDEGQPYWPEGKILPPRCEEAYQMWKEGEHGTGEYALACKDCCDIIYPEELTANANHNCQESCGTGGPPFIPGVPIGIPLG